MDQQVPQEKIEGTEAALTFSPPITRTWFVWIVVLIALLVGFGLALLWNPAIADKEIGENVANTILGSSAKTVPIDNVFFSIAFAIAAGLATTFTACNCVVFSCLAPLSSAQGKSRLGVVRLLLWMSLGVIVVTATYGVVGALLGGEIPSLSKATIALFNGAQMPVRLLQSSIVFVSLGVILVYWGLIALQIVGNPFRRIAQRYPWSLPLFLGAIVGFFSVGRPYALFNKLLQYSAGTGNAFLSALLVALQGLGNIAVMALLFVLLTRGTGGRFERWLQGNPMRAKVITAIAMIGGGVFFIFYWGLRLPAKFGIGWFPLF